MKINPKQIPSHKFPAKISREADISLTKPVINHGMEFALKRKINHKREKFYIVYLYTLVEVPSTAQIQIIQALLRPIEDARKTTFNRKFDQLSMISFEASLPSGN